ncbi:hypothetical protein ANO11243_091700 [Dothideomycetidae sp. 11243]|nr:hypothetical protein ANO11243_091700 [fungal sp. No.11243]
MAEAMGVISGIAGIAGFALQIVQELASFIDAIRDAPSALARVLRDLQALTTILEDLLSHIDDHGHGSPHNNDGLSQALKCCASDCSDFLQKLTNWTKNSTKRKLATWDKFKLGWMNKAAVDDFRQHLLQSKATLGLALGSLNVAPIADDLTSLSVAAQAAFNASIRQDHPFCLPGTRVQVLEDIVAFIFGDDDRCIFWLNGVAGTGKSTIARTICRKLVTDPGKHLGASYFFSRGQATAAATDFITTIAQQLAVSQPAPLRARIAETVRATPGVATMARQDQWRMLIVDPLSKCYAGQPRRIIVIVVDALDECAHDVDVKNLIPLLASLQALQSVRCRVIVTSRPEVPVRLGFRQSNILYHDLILHNVARDVVDADIRLCLQHELTQIKVSRMDIEHVDPLWPSAGSVNKLVDLSAGLFVFASTACRWIAGSQGLSLEESLTIVIDTDSPPNAASSDPATTWDLDQLYLQILERVVPPAVRGPARVDFAKAARRVLGWLALLREQISLTTLARYHETTTDNIRRWLQHLHSVIQVPGLSDDDKPLQFYHPSFREFLLNGLRCTNDEFHVEVITVHDDLAKQLLRVLSAPDGLRQDICKVGKPGMAIVNMDAAQIATHIGEEISYGCDYWIYHTLQSARELLDGGREHEFLQHKFLFWLEALAWNGRLANSVLDIKDLMYAIQCKADVRAGDLIAFLYDAWRFMLASCTVVEESPFQVYASALMFSPADGVIMRRFHQYKPDWVTVNRPSIAGWSAKLFTLRDHASRVALASFSPDGSLIATLEVQSLGTRLVAIRLWDSRTGRQLRKIDLECDETPLLCFSDDGKSLVTASSILHLIRYWDVQTGQVLRTTSQFNRTSRLAYCSNDGRLAVQQAYRSHAVRSTARDKKTKKSEPEVTVWDTKADIKLHLPGLDMDEAQIAIARSSISGHCLAIAFEDRSIMVWLSARESSRYVFQRTLVLQIEAYVAHALAVTEDGAMVAFPLYHDNMTVRDSKSGTEIQRLWLGKGGVTSIGFSCDNELLAAGCQDSSIKIWDIKTGAQVQQLATQCSSLDTLCFSPDRKLLVSTSNEQDPGVWDLTADESMGQELVAQAARINAMAFASSGALIATGDGFGNLRIWDAMTGNLLKKLPPQSPASNDSYSRGVHDLCFSPNGELLASAIDNSTVVVSSVDDGKHLHILAAESMFRGDIIFSRDSKMLATHSVRNEIRVWGTSTGELLYRLGCPRGNVSSTCFSPAGNVLASSYASGTICIWDLDRGIESQRIRAYEGEESYANYNADHVHRMCISPNGELLAALCGETSLSISVWRLEDPQDAQIFVIASTDVPSWIAFEPDGNRICTAIGEIIDINPASPSSDVPVSAGRLSYLNGWIYRDKQRYLFIPEDFRSEAIEAHDDMVAIGQKDGKVMIVRGRS